MPTVPRTPRAVLDALMVMLKDHRDHKAGVKIYDLPAYEIAAIRAARAIIKEQAARISNLEDLVEDLRKKRHA